MFNNAALLSAFRLTPTLSPTITSFLYCCSLYLRFQFLAVHLILYINIWLDFLKHIWYSFFCWKFKIIVFITYITKVKLTFTMYEFLFSKLSYFYFTLQFLLDRYEFWLYFIFHKNLNLVVQNIKYLLFDVLKRVQFYLKKTPVFSIYDIINKTRSVLSLPLSWHLHANHVCTQCINNLDWTIRSSGFSFFLKPFGYLSWYLTSILGLEIKQKNCLSSPLNFEDNYNLIISNEIISLAESILKIIVGNWI